MKKWYDSFSLDHSKWALGVFILISSGISNQKVEISSTSKTFYMSDVWVIGTLPSFSNTLDRWSPDLSFRIHAIYPVRLFNHQLWARPDNQNSAVGGIILTHLQDSANHLKKSATTSRPLRGAFLRASSLLVVADFIVIGQISAGHLSFDPLKF